MRGLYVHVVFPNVQVKGRALARPSERSERTLNRMLGTAAIPPLCQR